MNPDTAATAPPAPAEAGRSTRFYVFTASDDLRTFTFVGEQEANDRDQALRKQFGGHPPLSVAVSEHAWKVRKPRVEAVVRGLTDVGMPGGEHEAVADGDAVASTDPLTAAIDQDEELVQP